MTDLQFHELGWSYSASQIKAFLGCSTKWYFGWVEGFRSPQTASQAKGTEVHEALEAYYKNGADVESKEALELLKILPERGNDVRSELEFRFPIGEARVTNPSVVGAIDLIRISGKFINFYDFKTTSDLKWALTEYQLPKDVQAVIYAKWIFDKFPEVGMLGACWRYVTTKGKTKTLPVTAIMRRDEVETEWAKIQSVIHNMDKTSRLPIVESGFEGLKNGECDKFGGCPHRAVCTAVQTLGSEALEMFRPPDAPPSGDAEKEEDMAGNAKLEEIKRLALAKRAKEQAATEEAPAKSMITIEPKSKKQSPIAQRAAELRAKAQAKAAEEEVEETVEEEVEEEVEETPPPPPKKTTKAPKAAKASAPVATDSETITLATIEIGGQKFELVLKR